jgi:hypothetical protein
VAQASSQLTLHDTPTRASWLNLIERWLSILQGKSLAGGSFTSIEQLRDHMLVPWCK